LSELGYQDVASKTGFLIAAYGAGLIVSSPPVAYLGELTRDRQTGLLAALLCMMGAVVSDRQSGLPLSEDYAGHVHGVEKVCAAFGGQNTAGSQVCAILPTSARADERTAGQVIGCARSRKSLKLLQLFGRLLWR
jgi:hypothetical protein